MTAVVHAPSLFDQDLHEARPATLEERAAAWIRANPAAVARFTAVALDLHQRGERMGAKAIAEVIRWQHATDPTVGEDYRVNNSFVAHIARHVMATQPTLAGYFETRERCRG